MKTVLIFALIVLLTIIAVENLAAYDNWSKTHTDQYETFNTFQKNRVFRMPAGQYYQVN